LVLRPEKPTLFRDGDLVIVTPDVPGAIAEVKTNLTGARAWFEVAEKLARHGQLCKSISNVVPWLGVFSYDGDEGQSEYILNAVCQVYRDTGIPINCVCCGYDVFLRYWPAGEHEPGDDPQVDGPRSYWSAYRLDRLAPSYFISNLVDSISNIDREETDYVWFALKGGKRPYTIAERRLEDCQPGTPH
jgi:hypothetical protein